MYSSNWIAWGRSWGWSLTKCRCRDAMSAKMSQSYDSPSLSVFRCEQPSQGKLSKQLQLLPVFYIKGLFHPRSTLLCFQELNRCLHCRQLQGVWGIIISPSLQRIPQVFNTQQMLGKWPYLWCRTPAEGDCEQVERITKRFDLPVEYTPCSLSPKGRLDVPYRKKSVKISKRPLTSHQHPTPPL